MDQDINYAQSNTETDRAAVEVLDVHVKRYLDLLIKINKRTKIISNEDNGDRDNSSETA